jgi:LuxR family maltose regulon positive regulatory protein
LPEHVHLVLACRNVVSRDILAELERANLFLIPLVEAGCWYRYHHVFREMLRQKLHTQTGPDPISALHRRARRWLADCGQLDEALRHALAAKDVDTAKLFEDNSQDLLNRLEWYTLQRWLAMLPEEAIWGRPHLVITQAWLL